MNVPGVMEMLAAPVTDQFSALLVPVVMLAGIAAKDAMVGADPFPVPGDELDEVPAVQPNKPKQRDRVSTNA